MNRSKANRDFQFWWLLLTVIVLGLQGCATTRQPAADPLAYRNRAKTGVNGDVSVTVAVPTISEAYGIYGVDLAKRSIQPVWVEVKNDSAFTYWLLPSGLDPEYYPAPEAAFAFYSGGEEENRQIGRTFLKLQFQNPVPAGSTRSGFVLSNLDEGFKAVDIDLISRQDAKSYSFVIADPEFKADHKEVDFDAIYAAEDIVNIENEDELRRTLEALPGCATNADEDEEGDPLNLILIGDLNDIIPALVRRNWHTTEVIWSQAIRRTIKSFLRGERYRYSPISPLYAYGRKQDIAWQKARSSINERNHMRFWLSPIRFRGKPVFVGQISRDIGVKFTLKSPTISTHIIDPDVDEARRYFTEDLAYSQVLSRLAFVKGVGPVSKEAPRVNLVGDPFYTDGLRAVLFFDPRPFSLSDIELMGWEAFPAYQATLDADADPDKGIGKNEASVRARASTKAKLGIRASASVAGDQESREIFGIDLARKGIQAVWVEIENHGDQPILLLPTSIDPEYFAPLEVAFAYHRWLSKKANSALNERLLNLSFPNQSMIAPGTAASGYIFTNWSKGMKVVDVDLFGHVFNRNFTFFIPNPDTYVGEDFINRMEGMFSASELEHLETEAELRRALEALPCCVTRENEGHSGEPINVVVIGSLDDWTTGFVRRGYQFQPLTPRYVFGRPQDVSGGKQNRGYTKAQAHTIRLWQTPLRYRGLPVWVGLASSRLGGRFAKDAPAETPLSIDPHVDQARIDLAQDLAYSQTLTKIGHVKGAGRPQPSLGARSPETLSYETDGLRVVLVFGERPINIGEIDFFDWERFVD